MIASCRPDPDLNKTLVKVGALKHILRDTNKWFPQINKELRSIPTGYRNNTDKNN